MLSEISQECKVNNDEIAYIGDDVNDLEIMKQVGFSATPNDGNNVIKEIADYVCETKGGNGAFREIGDLIIRKIC